MPLAKSFCTVPCSAARARDLTKYSSVCKALNEARLLQATAAARPLIGRPLSVLPFLRWPERGRAALGHSATRQQGRDRVFRNSAEEMIRW
jgi:hypothetical protein